MGAFGDENDSASANATHPGSSDSPAAPQGPSLSAAVVSDEERERKKARSRRLVMPFAEYVERLRIKVERTDRDTIKSVPQSGIPVPLFPGETEEAYEQAFLETLTEQQRERKDDHTSRMRSARISFARQRANWFGRNEELDTTAVTITAHDLEKKPIHELPRAALCAVKYVTLALYKLQVGRKFFDKIKETPPSTIFRWYGTAIVPIYMPLEVDETREACEQRFTQWLQETNNVRPGELLSDKSPCDERRLRIAFAAAAMVEKMRIRVVMDFDTMWRRRVLPLVEYAAERQKPTKRSLKKNLTTNSSEYKPIPVPLFEGETEEQYEQSFLATLPQYQRSQYHLSAPPIHIRALQIAFANARAQWFARSEGATELSMDAVNNRCLKDLPPAGLCVVQHVRKHVYHMQVHSGFYSHLKKMSRSETYAVFGTVLPPVFMPRTENEMVERCEARFEKWRAQYPFATTEKPTDPLDERMCRIEFATTTGATRPTKKRKRNVDLIAPDVNKSASQWEIKKCRLCGCQKCITSAPDLVMGTSLSQSSSPENVTYSAVGQQSMRDVEAKLLGEYDAINQQLMMNEKVLEDAEAQLASDPVLDIHDTALVLVENEEFRRLINDEIDIRNSMLALSIVCMWRGEIDELTRMVDDPSATHFPHIQRASHHKCAQLTFEIKEKQSLADSLTVSVTAAYSMGVEEEVKRLEAQLASTGDELRQLRGQLRREFMRLLRFDERVRLLVQELLRRL